MHGSFHSYQSSNLYPSLAFIDSRLWHYTVLVVLVIDFGVHAVYLLYCDVESMSSWAAAICLLVYSVDCGLRCVVYHNSLDRSRVLILDQIIWAVMVILWTCQWFLSKQTNAVLVHLLFLALRLVLKPRARLFIKRVNTKKSSGVSIEKLRFHLLGITSLPRCVIDKLDCELYKVCNGRTEGDLLEIELDQFLAMTKVYPGLTFYKSPYSTWNVIKSTLNHWAKQRRDLFCCVVIMIVFACITPCQAYFLQQLTDEAFPSHSIHILKHGIFGLLIITLPFALANVGIGYFQSRMLAHATKNLQQWLLQVILSQPASFFHHYTQGDINNTFASDIARVNALWQAVFWNLFNPLVTSLIGIGYLMTCDFTTGWVVFVFVIALVSGGPQRRASRHSTTFGTANAELTSAFQTAIGLHATICVYDMQPLVESRFGDLVDKSSAVQFAKDLWATLVQVYVEAAMYFFVAVVTAGLASQVVSGRITTGQFLSTIAILGRLISPISVLGGFMRVAICNSSSLQRIDDLLSHAKATSPLLMPSNPLKMCLTLENVSFNIDASTQILRDISLKIPRGTFTCIVGPSGSGKSTLLSCMMQTLIPNRGKILWDGEDLCASHRQHVGVVLQNGALLDGTILDNLLFSNPLATPNDCMQALLKASCKFILDLPDGLQTNVASVQWSGGQMQRLCLARALVRHPSVLLLDEATSALDLESEIAVMDMLMASTKTSGTTVVLVTHRLHTTAVHADQVIVMNHGCIVEEGTHWQLMRQRGVYHNLARFSTDHEDGIGSFLTAGRAEYAIL